MLAVLTTLDSLRTILSKNSDYAKHLAGPVRQTDTPTLGNFVQQGRWPNAKWWQMDD